MSVAESISDITPKENVTSFCPSNFLCFHTFSFAISCGIGKLITYAIFH
jgi:hypothetical protein